MKAPDTFAQATESLYQALIEKGWPRSLRWLGPKDLRVRQSHVILRSGPDADGLRMTVTRYASALDASAAIKSAYQARQPVSSFRSSSPNQPFLGSILLERYGNKPVDEVDVLDGSGSEATIRVDASDAKFPAA